MSEPRVSELAALAEQVGALKLLPRTGWLQRGVAAAESVAEHSYGVVVLALAYAAGDAALDRGRLLAIAAVHDLGEALLGDLPLSARRLLGAESKHAAEQRAVVELLGRLAGGDELVALWEEYAAGASREARLVKALDRIETLAQALAYERAGNRALGEFWEGAAAGWDEFPLLGALALHLAAQRPAP